MNDDVHKHITKPNGVDMDEEAAIALEEVRLKALIKAEAEWQKLGTKVKRPVERGRRTTHDI